MAAVSGMPALVVALALVGLGLGVMPLGVTALAAAFAGLILLIGALGRWRGIQIRGRLLMATVLAVALLWGALHRPQPGADDPVRQLAGQSGPVPVTLRGTLLRDSPVGSEAFCRLPLAVAGGRVQLRLEPCRPLQEGWQLEVSGELSRPVPGAHALLAGAAERLAREATWSELRVQELQVLQRPATPIADLRRRMAAALIACGGPELGGVWAALVLGSAVVPVPAAVRESFRVAGLSHALAASGFHLTVLLGAVMAVARRSPAPLRWMAAGGAMGLFLLLAGPQPSVVRAVLMAAVAFAVLESGRRSRPLGILALTVLLMLLWSPSWLLDLGFQLSVAATAGLLLTAGTLEQGLAQRLPGWLATSVAVPVAACLWTLPLQLLHFGSVPLYAVPANLLAAPLLSPLTLGAMAMAVLAVLPGMAGVLTLLAMPLAPLTRLLLAITDRFAALPLAQWQLGRPLPWLVMLVTLGLLPWLLPLGWRGPAHLAPRRWGVVLLLVASVLHGCLLLQDQLLLVHQGGGDLLVARYRGHGALISTSADRRFCRQAGELALGLGLQRYDWVVVLDPVASEAPQCWQELTPTWMAMVDGLPVLQPGQRLESEGLTLQVQAASPPLHELLIGGRPWVLLPDRQSYWAWISAGAVGHSHPRAGLWLGFVPRLREQRQLARSGVDEVWISGERPARGPIWPNHWRASGASGSLQAGIS